MRAQSGVAKKSCKIIRRSCTKELQTGVAKGTANLGFKKELEKELQTEIAERSCQRQSQKDDEEARDDDKAGNAEKSGF